MPHMPDLHDAATPRTAYLGAGDNALSAAISARCLALWSFYRNFAIANFNSFSVINRQPYNHNNGKRKQIHLHTAPVARRAQPIRTAAALLDSRPHCGGICDERRNHNQRHNLGNRRHPGRVLRGARCQRRDG